MTDHERIQQIANDASDHILGELNGNNIAVAGVVISLWCPDTSPSANIVITGFETEEDPDDPRPLVEFLMAQLEQITGYPVRFLPVNEG